MVGTRLLSTKMTLFVTTLMILLSCVRLRPEHRGNGRQNLLAVIRISRMNVQVLGGEAEATRGTSIFFEAFKVLEKWESSLSTPKEERLTEVCLERPGVSIPPQQDRSTNKTRPVSTATGPDTGPATARGESEPPQPTPRVSPQSNNEDQKMNTVLLGPVW
ncbi:uncharacterized protein LOC110466286 [Mizuhopecten yessoensis]|nr:uncharacterized protein LOC110466286 [Mizuhopecten yessoensis]